MKRIIKLKESELKRLIAESAMRLLNENEFVPSDDSNDQVYPSENDELPIGDEEPYADDMVTEPTEDSNYTEDDGDTDPLGLNDIQGMNSDEQYNDMNVGDEFPQDGEEIIRECVKRYIRKKYNL